MNPMMMMMNPMMMGGGMGGMGCGGMGGISARWPAWRPWPNGQMAGPAWESGSVLIRRMVNLLISLLNIDED